MPRFLCLYKSAKGEGAPPSAADQEKMGVLIAEWVQAGVLLSAEGCMPSTFGVRIRQDKGKVTVTDGPFAESKEIVGGLAIIQAPSKEEAIPWIKKFLEVAGDGESEVRQLWDQPAQ